MPITVCNASGHPLELLEIVAEHLYGDVAAHARDELVEAHLDGLAHLEGVAGEVLHPLFDALDDVVLAIDTLRPLIARPENHECVGDVLGHRIGRDLGGSGLRIDERHFR